MKIFFHILVAVLSITSCSSKKPAQQEVAYKENSPQINTPRPQTPSVTSKMLGSEQGTDLVTEFSFKKDSAELTTKAQKRLKNLFEKASKQGEVKEIQVVTWADKEYPSDEKSKLSESDQRLIDDRNKSIQNYLEELDKDIKFTLVNMGERTTFLNRVMASDKAEIKKSLQTASIATTENEMQGPKQASKSIVMVLLD